MCEDCPTERRRYRPRPLRVIAVRNPEDVPDLPLDPPEEAEDEPKENDDG